MGTDASRSAPSPPQPQSEKSIAAAVEIEDDSSALFWCLDSRQFLFFFACVIAGPPRRLRVLDWLRDCRGCGSGSYHISSLVEVEYGQSLEIAKSTPFCY